MPPFGALFKFWREILIAVLLLAVVTQQTRVANEQASHSKTKANNYLVLKDLADKTALVYKRIVEEHNERTAKIAKDDADNRAVLRKKQDEVDAINECVRSGKCGLRVAATCKPATTGTGLSQESTTSSLVDGSSPQLTPEAQQNYFSLRQDLLRTESQVIGLQKYILEINK